MKRILLSITGTVAGLVALLGFKTHSPLTSGTLPSAALPAGATPTTPTKSTAAGTPTRAPSPSTTTIAARTYAGQAVQTQYGVVQVAATVQNGKITNVRFLQLTAYDDRSQQINSFAAPVLLQETLSAQSSQIDSVSGATYTSAGYEQSLQSALDQAGIR